MKNIKSAFITVLALVALAVTISGCGKAATENKLIGRWTRINVDNLADTSRTEDWEFLGAPVVRIYYSHNLSDTNFVEGTYMMKNSKEFTVSGTSEDGWPSDANGNWRIVKLKKNSLIVVRDEGGHGLTFREFKKY